MSDLFNNSGIQTPEPEGKDDPWEAGVGPSGNYKTFAFIWEVLKIVIVVVAIVIPIKVFIFQPFFVRGASMEDTFHDGDYILIDEIGYRLNEPKRGDIVVFRYPNDPKEFFIKRVIGLPSETITIKNNRITIFNKETPEGFVLDESSYLSPGQFMTDSLLVKLDPNEYYVLGDNRLHSSDSRIWGPVNESRITGRVFARAWPLSKASLFDRPTYLNEP